MNYKDSKGNPLDAEFVINVINAGYKKANSILAEGKSLYLDEEHEFNIEETQDIILSRLFLYLMKSAQLIDDLTQAITIGGTELIEQFLEKNKLEIHEISEETMNSLLEDYVECQNVYADFNNKELRIVLFETATRILSFSDLVCIQHGIKYE